MNPYREMLKAVALTSKQSVSELTTKQLAESAARIDAIVAQWKAAEPHLFWKGSRYEAVAKD